MTRNATAERSTTDESSSLTTSDATSSEESFSIETSVMPPAYLPPAATLENSEPNAASISSASHADSESLSHDVCDMSHDDSSEAANDDSEVADEMTSDNSEAEFDEEESADEDTEEESDEESDDEASSEDAEDEEESEENETDEESEDGEGNAAADGEGDSADGTVTTDQGNETNLPASPAALLGGGGDDEEFESIEVLTAKLPRMHPIIPPYVGNPPPQAIERRDEIIKRTSAPPDLHHARVRQAAEQVTQAARDAQRRMIVALGRIGRDSRLSIEEMANQIAQATSSAVAQITLAINNAKTQIGQEASNRNNSLTDKRMLVGDALETNRNAVSANVAAQLKSGSSAVQKLATRAEAIFNGQLSDAQGKIAQIPTQGKAERIPDPPLPRGSTPRKPQKPPEAPKYDVVSKTVTPLALFINNQASTVEDGFYTWEYYRGRSNPVAEGLRQRTQRQLVDSATKKGNALNSDTTRGQFLINLLGLTTPVSEHHEFDESRDESKEEKEYRESHSEAQTACHRAQNTITEKSKLATEYLDNDLRKNLTDNLWKSGRKAEKSFKKQAIAAEVAQNNNAATLAEAYRTLVKRLDAMLPQGQFLDSRRLLPKLLKERDAAFKLQRQHEQLAKQQADATVTQLDKSKREQIEGIEKSVTEGRKGIGDVVTRVCFDMDFFLQQVTTGLTGGASAVNAGALDYATRTAQSILDSISNTDNRGILQIQGAAVGFLNGQIGAAEQSQYARLEAFVESMTTPGEDGPLVSPMLEARSDFETRATNLHNAMPERSFLGGLASGIAGGVLLGPIGAVAAVGTYIYETDPSENKVITNLGNVAYPGPPAIGEVFHRLGYGNLEGRIRDRLSNPEKQQALGLFSSSPRVRGDVRRGIAERSTDLFGYNREAREAAVAGMSAEESAAMDPADIESTRALLESELDQNQADIANSFIAHNRERAIAAMTRDALDTGTRSSSWGWIFSAEDSRRASDRARVDAVARLDSNLRQTLAIENAFAAQMTSQDVIPDPMHPDRNMTIGESRTHVYQEFAFLTDERNRNVSTPPDAARSIDANFARRNLVDYASRDYTATVIGPRTIAGAALLATPLAPFASIGIGAGLAGDQTNVSMSADARNYIDAMVNAEPDSDRVRSARGIFEVRRAESEGGRASESTQVTLSEAVENRTLARYLRDAKDPRKTPEEQSRAQRLADEELVRHRERMREMAIGLGADPNITGEAAVEYMANRVGNIFENSGTSGYNFTGALTDAFSLTANLQSFGLFNAVGGADFLHHAASGGGHRRYGEEMIRGGRASLDASVALATDGIGTNEDLLRRSYADRSQEEIRQANAAWARDHDGENMEEMLGIRHRSMNASDYGLLALSPAAWFMTRGAETSGDLAMELEVLSLGNPETDEDRLRIADLRQRQERRGTGWLGRLTMSGSTEESNLDGTRNALANAVLAQLRTTNPTLAAKYADNPGAIIGPDGRVIESVRSLTFDARGNFLGDRTLFAADVGTMRNSADAYRARIDRIESALTTFIAVGAFIASIALMLIPGVNVVAAGIAVALIAGAATIAVKMGMRGERYGWEEMATDIATTAIEAATAGISGGIAGGFKAGPFARLANVGKLLESGFGRIGGAIVREAVVNAVSSAASTAIQDEVWKDGFGKGLERVANGAIRGAVVGAVSTGLSEGISAGMSRRMSAAAQAAEGKMTVWQQLAQRLGPHGAEMLREAISNGAGALASESIGIAVDYAQGNFHGNFGEALKRIGFATLREAVSGGLRGGITSMHKENYRQLLEAAHANPHLSDSQLHALRLFGISAGVLNYDTSLNQLRSDIGEAHNLLNRLPSGIREHAQKLDLESLRSLAHVIESGDVGYRVEGSKANQEHLQLMRDLESSVPGLDIRKLMQEIDTSVDSHRIAKDQQAMDPAQQHELRSRLGSHMNEELKFALDRVPVDGLQHLSETELQQAAAMVASGKYNREQADALFRAVKARNPEADELQFLSHLNKAVEQSAETQRVAAKAAEVRRQQLTELVPKEAAPIFAGLSDVEAKLAHQLISNGLEGTPHQQEALFRAAQAKNPELTSEQFHQFIAKAAADSRTRIEAEASTKRTQREQNMTHVPEELRSTLSALSESGLVELRLRQMEGSVSPAEKLRLIENAQKTTPGIDVHALSAAIDKAVATPPKQRVGDAEAIEMRQQMLRGVPADQRGLIESTHIMVLSDAEFNALTRSAKGQAATLIIDGKPVIIVREGANPRVLREEGIHALQAHDPQWAKHIGALEEHQLADWDKLPLEQQIELYRNKVALEIDAHQKLIHSLEGDISHATTEQERHAIKQQLEQTHVTRDNLLKRLGDVSGFDASHIASIRAGVSEKPQWLDQPARLFSKDDKSANNRSSAMGNEVAIKKAILRAVDASRRAEVESLLAKLPPEAVHSLHALAEHTKKDAQLFNRMMLAVSQSGNPSACAEAMHRVATLAQGDQQLEILKNMRSMKISDLATAMDSVHQLLRLPRDEATKTKILLESMTQGSSVDRLGLLAKIATNGGSLNEINRLNNHLTDGWGLATAQQLNPKDLSRLLSTEISGEHLHLLMKTLATHDNPSLLLESLESIGKALGASGVYYAASYLKRGFSAELIIDFGKLARLAPNDSNLQMLMQSGTNIPTKYRISEAGSNVRTILENDIGQLVKDRVMLIERAQALRSHADVAHADADSVAKKIDILQKQSAEQQQIHHDNEAMAKSLGQNAARELAEARRLQKQAENSDLDEGQRQLLSKAAKEAEARAKSARENGAAARARADEALLKLGKLAPELNTLTRQHKGLVERASEKAATAMQAEKNLSEHRRIVEDIAKDNASISKLRAEALATGTSKHAQITSLESTQRKSIDALNAEVSSAQGMTDKHRESLRKKSPGPEMRKEVLTKPIPEDLTPTGELKDWVTGQPVVAKSNVTDADHIYPFAKIIKEPGFSELPEHLQLEVLNMRENLAPMESKRNESKNDRDLTTWLASSGKEVPTLTQTQLDLALKREQKAREAVRARIRELVEAWRAR